MIKKIPIWSEEQKDAFVSSDEFPPFESEGVMTSAVKVESFFKCAENMQLAENDVIAECLVTGVLVRETPEVILLGEEFEGEPPAAEPNRYKLIPCKARLLPMMNEPTNLYRDDNYILVYDYNEEEKAMLSFYMLCSLERRTNEMWVNPSLFELEATWQQEGYLGSGWTHYSNGSHNDAVRHVENAKRLEIVGYQFEVMVETTA